MGPQRESSPRAGFFKALDRRGSFQEEHTRTSNRLRFGSSGSLSSGMEDRFEQHSVTDTPNSSTSECLSSDVGDSDLRFASSASAGHVRGDDLASTCSATSSPLRWPLGPVGSRTDSSRRGPELSPSSSKLSNGSFMWEEKREKRETELSEVEMMKERFAKLLLGEDMSGGGKGVSTALAISNAMTNLSASVFGELWRLEPLAIERRTMWRRELEWLLSVSDHIVEFVPSWQHYPDGSSTEVMVTRPRTDLHVNLPALRKLDTMLLDSLDGFGDTDFWYVDKGIDKDSNGGSNHSSQRQEEKWWLPTPRVPLNGLSEDARKRLQYQRESTNQILKAAMAINSSVLQEMYVPDAYWENLPKTGKATLGDAIYRGLVADNFSPDAVLSGLDLTNEHNVLDIANRLESAIHIWRRKIQVKHMDKNLPKESKYAAKSSWVKDLVGEVDREHVAHRAESLLVSLRIRFTGLPQTNLDTQKILYNKDVGQSILESYSRVLESLAYNIISRIDDVLYADDIAKRAFAPLPPPPGPRPVLTKRSVAAKTLISTPYATPFTSPSQSPAQIPGLAPGSPYVNVNKKGYKLGPTLGKALSEYIVAKDAEEEDEKPEMESHGKPPLPEKYDMPKYDSPKYDSPRYDSPKYDLSKFDNPRYKTWSYAGSVDALHSPPSRD